MRVPSRATAVHRTGCRRTAVRYGLRWATGAALLASVVGGMPRSGATQTTVSRFAVEGEVGDRIVGGRAAAVSGNVAAAQHATGDPYDVYLAEGSQFWELQLAAPDGAARPTTGLFADAAGTSERRAPGVAGLSFAANGVACSVVAGSYLVDQVDFDDLGRITALAVRFRQHCDGAAAAAFGSVAFNASVPVYSHRLSSTSLEVPRTPVGERSAPVRLRLTNTSSIALPVVSITLTGAGAADFEVSANECNGVTLALDASCDVSVVAAPTHDGPLDAQLVVADAFTAWGGSRDGEIVPVVSGAVARIDGQVTGNTLPGAATTVETAPLPSPDSTDTPGTTAATTAAPTTSTNARTTPASSSPPTVAPPAAALTGTTALAAAEPASAPSAGAAVKSAPPPIPAGRPPRAPRALVVGGAVAALAVLVALARTIDWVAVRRRWSTVALGARAPGDAPPDAVAAGDRRRGDELLDHPADDQQDTPAHAGATELPAHPLAGAVSAELPVCLVAVLGEPMVGGSTDVGARALEVLVRLADAPGGLTGDELAELVGVTGDDDAQRRSRLSSLVSRARSQLGTVGDEPLVPRISRGESYRVHPAVSLDLHRLEAAVDAARHDPGAVEGLASAVAFVRGRPFGVEAPAWATDLVVRAHAAIAWAIDRLVEDALARRDLADAERIAAIARRSGAEAKPVD